MVIERGHQISPNPCKKCSSLKILSSQGRPWSAWLNCISPFNFPSLSPLNTLLYQNNSHEGTSQTIQIDDSAWRFISMMSNLDFCELQKGNALCRIWWLVGWAPWTDEVQMFDMFSNSQLLCYILFLQVLIKRLMITSLKSMRLLLKYVSSISLAVTI